MLARMDAPPPGPENVRGLYRSEFERMVALGMFEGQRVELIDGQLVEMSPQGDAHSSVTAYLARWFAKYLPQEMQIRQHSGIRAGQLSMPEPDIAVIEHRAGHYQPETAFLIVEVSDSSLRNDVQIKSGVYASLGVPEYWVVDLVHEQVIVHTQPSVRGYKKIVVNDRAASLRPTAIPMLILQVSDILDCT